MDYQRKGFVPSPTPAVILGEAGDPATLVGWALPTANCYPSSSFFAALVRLPPSRSMAARGQSLLAVAPKVTKMACPCCPPDPPVLALCGMRWTGHGRAANASPIVTRQRIYDRTTLRASGRAEGALEPTFDRFAMRTTRTRMRASGLRLLNSDVVFV